MNWFFVEDACGVFYVQLAAFRLEYMVVIDEKLCILITSRWVVRRENERNRVQCQCGVILVVLAVDIRGVC